MRRLLADARLPCPTLGYRAAEARSAVAAAAAHVGRTARLDALIVAALHACAPPRV